MDKGGFRSWPWPQVGFRHRNRVSYSSPLTGASWETRRCERSMTPSARITGGDSSSSHSPRITRRRYGRDLPWPLPSFKRKEPPLLRCEKNNLPDQPVTRGQNVWRRLRVFNKINGLPALTLKGLEEGAKTIAVLPLIL